MNPTLVAIAGGSCSGKTSVARGLRDVLAPPAVVVEIDAYYRDADGVPEHELDVDVPEAIDHTLLVEHLHALTQGRAVDRPDYDYATHSRLATTTRVEPADVVIVEGLFALHWEEVRALCGLRVFVEAPPELCLARRIERDLRERGRSEQETRDRFTLRVLPNYERYVLPTRNLADVVLDGTAPIDEIIRVILRSLS